MIFLLESFLGSLHFLPEKRLSIQKVRQASPYALSLPWIMHQARFRALTSLSLLLFSLEAVISAYRHLQAMVRMPITSSFAVFSSLMAPTVNKLVVFSGSGKPISLIGLRK